MISSQKRREQHIKHEKTCLCTYFCSHWHSHIKICHGSSENTPFFRTQGRSLICDLRNSVPGRKIVIVQDSFTSQKDNVSIHLFPLMHQHLCCRCAKSRPTGVLSALHFLRSLLVNSNSALFLIPYLQCRKILILHESFYTSELAFGEKLLFTLRELCDLRESCTCRRRRGGKMPPPTPGPDPSANTSNPT